MKTATKPVSLKFNGAPLNLRALDVTGRLKRHLDSCPKDEVFSTEQIAKALQMPGRTVRNVSLPQHSAPVGKFRFWGHPDAIAELRRQVEASR